MLRPLHRPSFRRALRSFSSSNAVASAAGSDLEQQVAALAARVAFLEEMVANRSKMRYRPLGATGLNVSTLSLGCAPLGNVYGDISSSESDRLVKTCIEKGVNFLDTSPYYGDTVSESVLGGILKDVPRDSYILATKVGRYGTGSDFRGERIAASIDESRERLGVDCIDLIQCHDIEFADSLERVVHEALPAMEEARRAGKVKHIGITGLPLNVVDHVLENAGSGVTIESILTYCCYTLNNTQLDQYIPRWRHRGLGIIQGGATSMGLLTPQGPPDWHPAPDLVRQTCREAVELCDRLGEDVVKVAFQYTFAQPDIATVLVGVTSTEQLDVNLRWLNEPLDMAVAEEVQAALDPIRNKIWVETGSEENIALSAGGLWAAGRPGEEANKILGSSANLGRTKAKAS